MTKKTYTTKKIYTRMLNGHTIMTISTIMTMSNKRRGLIDKRVTYWEINNKNFFSFKKAKIYALNN